MIKDSNTRPPFVDMMDPAMDLPPNSLKTVSIMGAGLVGCLASIYYAEAGWNVQVYEQRKDLRTTPFSRERSINMALSFRGMLALRHAQFPIETLLPWMVPMEGRMIHKLNGELEAQPYGLNGECIYSIDRRKLNESLLNQAEKLPNVNFNFEHELKEIDWDQMKSRFFDKKTHSYVTVKQDVIVGADGAYSAVRREMIRPTRMSVHQDYMDHAYLELTLPAVESSNFSNQRHADEENEHEHEHEHEHKDQPTFAMAPTHLHIWPRHKFMLIALPNPDGSFTCTFFAPWSLFDTLTSDSKVLEFFETYFPDTVPLFTPTRLLAAFHHHPRSPLLQISCSTYHLDDKAILLGDAAHAMVPFFGQGMNCGFEDIDVLFQLMTTKNDTPRSISSSFDDKNDKNDKNDKDDKDDKAVFARYTSSRHRDVTAIVAMAQSNYIEMRSSVVNPLFQWQTFLIRLYARWVPGFLPMYSLVSFTNVPYHVCQAKGRRQARCSAWVIAGAGAAMCVGIGWGGYAVVKWLYRASPSWVERAMAAWPHPLRGSWKSVVG